MSGRYCRRRWQLADKIGNARQRVIYRVWKDLVDLTGERSNHLFHVLEDWGYQLAPLDLKGTVLTAFTATE